jgi:hypothetical protein
MNAPGRDVLFHSAFAEYSVFVLDQVVRRGLRESILLINVDRQRFRLPQAVTSVPTLVTADKRVLVDEAIMQYLDGLRGDVAAPASCSSAPIDPLPFLDGLAGQGFVFLSADGSGYEQDPTAVRSDAFATGDNWACRIGEDNIITTPPDRDSSNDRSSSSSSAPSPLDALVNARKLDDERVLQQLDQNGGRLTR